MKRIDEFRMDPKATARPGEKAAPNAIRSTRKAAEAEARVNVPRRAEERLHDEEDLFDDVPV